MADFLAALDLLRRESQRLRDCGAIAPGSVVAIQLANAIDDVLGPGVYVGSDPSHLPPGVRVLSTAVLSDWIIVTPRYWKRVWTMVPEREGEERVAALTMVEGSKTLWRASLPGGDLYDANSGHGHADRPIDARGAADAWLRQGLERTGAISGERSR